MKVGLPALLDPVCHSSPAITPCSVSELGDSSAGARAATDLEQVQIGEALDKIIRKVDHSNLTSVPVARRCVEFAGSNSTHVVKLAAFGPAGELDPAWVVAGTWEMSGVGATVVGEGDELITCEALEIRTASVAVAVGAPSGEPGKSCSVGAACRACRRVGGAWDRDHRCLMIWMLLEVFG